MMASDIDGRVDAIRAFSRFYTRRIGVLHEGLLGSSFSLAEGRVIWELAQSDDTTATALHTTLDLDPGYLSRILRRLEGDGLIARRPAPGDARQSTVSLTASGRAAYDAINATSHDEIAALLRRLAPCDQTRLVEALGAARTLLGDGAPSSRVVLRTHRPGDMGWVVHRQAVLYCAELGWEGSFETLLAEIAAAFIRDFRPAREACWLAERDGAILGSVTLVRQSDEVAKLRMLYVERAARGAGVGRLLVERCIAFARAAGYARITLWTNDVLTEARQLYAATGFRLVAADPPALAFGVMMASETWELELPH